MKKKLQKDKIPSILVQEISLGIDKTTSEWARRFHVSEGYMRKVFTELRKGGFPIFPIGTILGGFNGESKEGIMKDITTNKKYYKEAMDRYAECKVLAYLNCFIFSAVNAIDNFPDMRPKIFDVLTNGLYLILDGQKQLKLNSPKNHGNNSDSNRENKA